MYDLTSQRALAGAAGAVSKIYIEDVFSTWLYTGNGSTQTITNGIDLSGKGGLVWIKSRSAINNNFLTDTVRGGANNLISNSTAAQANDGTLTFSSTGFTAPGSNGFGNNNVTFASWTFRKQAKFFDVVTYTGNGTNNDIAHSLGVAPGFILIKRTDSISDWFAYPRYDDSGNATFPYLYKGLKLNTTDASAGNFGGLASSTILRANSTGGNINGATYVAYLFAHDAGGFGDSGNDNVISCGTFTGDSTVNLGWEPQWVLFKQSNGVGNWRILDNMRGMPVIASSTGSQQVLFPNTSGVESTDGVASPTPTGFTTFLGGGTYIYIAIRRGPMKTPTDATKVFSATAGTNTSPYSVGFPTDLAIIGYRDGDAIGLFAQSVGTRLTGNSANLYTSRTAAEDTSEGQTWSFDLGVSFDQNWVPSAARWNFRRAPGFFDVVAYTGTGAAQTVSHNLGVVPELLIIKGRNQSTNWKTYYSFTSTTYKDFNLNGTSAASNGTYGPGGFPNFESFSTAPTATSFSVSANSVVINNTGTTYIGYLFATCPGVSKVGSYTGTGTTLQVNCGFTNGARFVLIKRTDSTGDWYVWDSARGIVAGNDPYLLLNSTAAEVTSTDYVDTYNAGFELSSTAPAAINANGGTFVFLAVA